MKQKHWNRLTNRVVRLVIFRCLGRRLLLLSFPFLIDLLIEFFYRMKYFLFVKLKLRFVCECKWKELHHLRPSSFLDWIRTVFTSHPSVTYIYQVYSLAIDMQITFSRGRAARRKTRLRTNGTILKPFSPRFSLFLEKQKSSAST